MAKRKIAGPGRLGSIGAVKKSLKGGGIKGLKIIPGESSITVRFLDELEDFFGYYEHYANSGYIPCTTDECAGCNSDDPDESRKSFKYLANCYVVDDQKVMAVKMPKSVVDQLVLYNKKYDGTIKDRDYDLSRSGSGMTDTKYMVSPDAPSVLKMSRFKDKMIDLEGLLDSMLGDNDDVDDDDEDDDDEPVVTKKKKRPDARDPWESKPKKKTGTTVVKKKRLVRR